jgi:hypothetical protein
MRRPDGIDYGCYGLKVADQLPEDGLPSGTAKYFGERMAAPMRKSKRQRMRPTLAGGKRPDQPIMRAVQSHQQRMDRLAKFGNAADYD